MDDSRFDPRHARDPRIGVGVGTLHGSYPNWWPGASAAKKKSEQTTPGSQATSTCETFPEPGYVRGEENTEENTEENEENEESGANMEKEQRDDDANAFRAGSGRSARKGRGIPSRGRKKSHRRPLWEPSAASSALPAGTRGGKKKVRQRTASSSRRDVRRPGKSIDLGKVKSKIGPEIRRLRQAAKRAKANGQAAVDQFYHEEFGKPLFQGTSTSVSVGPSRPRQSRKPLAAADLASAILRSGTMADLLVEAGSVPPARVAAEGPSAQEMRAYLSTMEQIELEAAQLLGEGPQERTKPTYHGWVGEFGNAHTHSVASKHGAENP